VTSIDQLPRITELARTHNELRERLAEIREGSYKVTLSVYPRGARCDGDGEHITISAEQGADLVLRMIAGTRGELRRLGVDTPDPPPIVVAMPT
jgi:hypothetical protein